MTEPEEGSKHLDRGQGPAAGADHRQHDRILADLGMKIEIASWRNIVPHVWSLHIRDAASPACFTNGKGATKESRAVPRRWASSSSA